MSLEEVAFLENNTYRVNAIDLENLFGGRPLVIDCTLETKNNSQFPISALIDTGANGYAFADRKQLRDWYRNSKIKMTRYNLRHPLSIRGFDGGSSRPLRHAYVMTLTIDSHRVNMPFFATTLGNKNNVILGRQWLAYHNVLPDCVRHRLWWPEDRNDHQWDANRRDRLIELPPLEINKPPAKRSPHFMPKQILKRPAMVAEAPATPSIILTPRPTLQERQEAYDKKKEDLGLDEMDTPTLSAVEVETIEAEDQCWFVEMETACDGTEIAHIAELAEEEEKTQLLAQLPPEYHDLAHVFSKRRAKELPPHREFDHKINLDSEPELKQAPLYKMNQKELDTVHAYIEENLANGFIEPSDSPFNSPVLFVKKKNGDLRFCVDYRKLNAHTRKDRYPLPLIGETLAKMAGSKKFTILDVIHAFNRIQMHPDFVG